MTINKYAIIENDIVKDIIIAEPEFVVNLDNYVLVTDNVGIGFSYLNGIFIEPPIIDIQIINNNNYIKLYDSFLVSSSYQKIRAEALTHLPVTVASTEIISALTDAKYGIPNVSAIQQCINNLLTSVTTLDANDFAEIGGLFVAAGLDTLYTLPTPPE